MSETAADPTPEPTAPEQPNASESAQAEPAKPAYKLDLEQHGDVMIPVDVNGEQQLVSARDAADNYRMRAEHELAVQQLESQNERVAMLEKLHAAVTDNPRRLTEQLASSLGLQVTPAGQPPAQPPQQEYADPYDNENSPAPAQQQNVLQNPQTTVQIETLEAEMRKLQAQIDLQHQREQFEETRRATNLPATVSFDQVQQEMRRTGTNDQKLVADALAYRLAQEQQNMSQQQPQNTAVLTDFGNNNGTPPPPNAARNTLPDKNNEPKPLDVGDPLALEAHRVANTQRILAKLAALS